jgi:hypothetical protein
MARFERIRTISLAICLGFPAENVSAASRFETGGSVPVQSRAHLDFTIVIPEFVWLRPPEHVEVVMPPDNHDTQEGESTPPSWSVTGNGGPIVSAFFAEGQDSQSRERSSLTNAIATFAIAAP